MSQITIVFNLFGCGLGNNGGSLTLIESANILKKLGHNVIIVDGGKNQNTWVKLKAEHKIIKNINDFPECDVVIATGYKTVNPTINIKNKCLKMIWMRGWELWQMPENKIIKNILKSPLIKVVNGICLQNKLKKLGFESYLIRPGHNFNNFKNLNIRDDKKIILGGLYHTKHQTKRTDWIIQTAKKLKTKYKNIELWMFGSSSNPNNYMIDKYIRQPDIKEKNKFYNKVDIWLSTSNLEGLHIVPQEAMLCGCTVIGTNAEMAGTKDYLINNETGIVSNDNLNDFIDNVKILIKNNNLRKKLSECGRNKILELGDRKDNMRKFIKLMERLINERGSLEKN